jgi:hypothetical protein
MEQGIALPENRNARPSAPVVVAVIAIAVGVVLRVVEFWRARPLWLDEAMLGLNVASRNFAQLARPLDYDQSAPLLYLWLERLAVVVAGVNERTLRLLPFIAGIAVVPLLWVVARRLAGETTAAIATVLVALSVTLVTFSAEAKQYGVDPLATLSIMWLSSRVHAAPGEPRRWNALLFGGVAGLLLSQPAVFVLGGAFAALAADHAVRQSPGVRRRFAVSAAICAIVFVPLYFGVYRGTAQSAYMRHFWEGTFLDPRTPDFLLRLRLFDTAAFVAPVLSATGIGVAGALAVAWALGLALLWKRNRFAAIVVGAPLILAACATSLGLYAVMDRLFLFAAPLTLMAYAALVARVVELAPASLAPVALGGAAVALAAVAAPTHASRIAHPVFFAAGKQVIADIDSMSRGEPVYVAARSFPLWIYYTTDWSAPDADRLRWAASISGAGMPAHNNAPSAGSVSASDTGRLSRRYRGRVELVGLPTGRQYLTTTRTLSRSLPAADYAVPASVDRGWAELEVQRMASAARPRLWVFGSHMFALDGAEPGLVAELQRRNVKLVMERRQGSTVGYHVEFPGEP